MLELDKHRRKSIFYYIYFVLLFTYVIHEYMATKVFQTLHFKEARRVSFVISDS